MRAGGEIHRCVRKYRLGRRRPDRTPRTPWDRPGCHMCGSRRGLPADTTTTDVTGACAMARIQGVPREHAGPIVRVVYRFMRRGTTKMTGREAAHGSGIE